MQRDDDEHDDPSCRCDECERDRARAETRALASEARANGGLSPLAHELLGPGWFEQSAQGETVTQIEKLAQRTLGDVFEHLESIGRDGRARCQPSYAFRGSEAVEGTVEPLYQHEAREFISLVENALEYALLQIEHLPRDESRPDNDNGDQLQEVAS